MKSLFFIGRHGETFLNSSNCFRGWSNGPDARLDKDGIKGAHFQGQFLAKTGQKFTKIISSPLHRAEHTAAIVAGYIGIDKIQIDDRLMPLNVGDLAGKPKAENPISEYLKNRKKQFPNGESVDDFENRQRDFGQDLLTMVEVEKNIDEDNEILVMAHTSNSMFWWNIFQSKSNEEYLDEGTDILEPNGLAIVTEHDIIPVFRANPEAQEPGLKIINSSEVKGEPGTGYEARGDKGPFQCSNCEYFDAASKSCGQQTMMSKSKQLKLENGRIKVDPEGCCEYQDRP